MLYLDYLHTLLPRAQCPTCFQDISIRNWTTYMQIYDPNLIRNRANLEFRFQEVYSKCMDGYLRSSVEQHFPMITYLRTEV